MGNDEGDMTTRQKTPHKLAPGPTASPTEQSADENIDRHVVANQLRL